MKGENELIADDSQIKQLEKLGCKIGSEIKVQSKSEPKKRI